MQTDVLIVGAGLSGLYLASGLQKNGIDYRLLEARKRVGGRILSIETTRQGTGAGFVDMGPSWIWPGQPRIAELLKHFEINVFEQYSKGRLVYEDDLARVRRDYDYSTMAGALRIQDGVASLTTALAASLSQNPVRLSQVVTGIRKVEFGYEVAITTPDNEFDVQSRRIVLSIPPRVISNSIRFEPILSDQVIDTLNSIPTWMAGHAKLFAIYERPFWRELGLSGDGISRRGPLVEIHDASPDNEAYGSLMGFVGIPAGHALREPSTLIKNATTQLENLFGPGAANPVDVIFKDWSHDIFTATDADKLTTPHPVYGMPPILEPLADKGLYLASTETASRFGGFIEGALEASENVFNRLMVDLKVPSGV